MVSLAFRDRSVCISSPQTGNPPAPAGSVQRWRRDDDPGLLRFASETQQSRGQRTAGVMHRKCRRGTAALGSLKLDAGCPGSGTAN